MQHIYILDDNSVVFEGTLSEEQQPCSICNSKVRMKVTPRRRPHDPVIIELSFTSDGFTHERFRFPTARVRGKHYKKRCTCLNNLIYRIKTFILANFPLLKCQLHLSNYFRGRKTRSVPENSHTLQQTQAWS